MLYSFGVKRVLGKKLWFEGCVLFFREVEVIRKFGFYFGRLVLGELLGFFEFLCFLLSTRNIIFFL